MISDALPSPIKVVAAAATGFLRAEVAAALKDDDFEVVSVADARQAAEAAASLAPHALVVIGDDLVNGSMDELVQRVRVAAPGRWRIACVALYAHASVVDLSSAYHGGGDDVARWPLEPDMLRARVRSLVRASALEASMNVTAQAGTAGLADLRSALAQSVHLINNSVAGISGRAQLVALTGGDDSGLVPVCLSEARKMGVILASLHRLAESVHVDEASEHDADAELAALLSR